MSRREEARREGRIIGEDEVFIAAADTYHNGLEFFRRCGRDDLFEKFRKTSHSPDYPGDSLFAEQSQLLGSWSIQKGKPAFLTFWKVAYPSQWVYGRGQVEDLSKLDQGQVKMDTGIKWPHFHSLLNKEVEL